MKFFSIIGAFCLAVAMGSNDANASVQWQISERWQWTPG